MENSSDSRHPRLQLVLADVAEWFRALHPFDCHEVERIGLQLNDWLIP